MLTITPTRIEVGITEEVNLQCIFRGSASTSDLVSVTMLRILKETTPTNFEIYASIKDTDTEAQNTQFGPAANVTGFIGQLTSSYLSVTWRLATNSVLGSYRCDVIGFKQNQDFVTERSPIFVVKESNVTLQDVIDLVNREKVDLEKQLAAQKVYCDSRIAVVESEIDVKIADIRIDQENASHAFEDRLMAELKGLQADVKRLMDTGVLQYWPEGTYALLTPDSGCPNNVGAQWSSGYSKFHTESTDRNYDQTSVPSHLKLPTLERLGINNFVYLYFCVSPTLSPGADWPRGAYCINRVGPACPGGFSSGSITWQDEVIGSASNISGAVPAGVYAANRTTITYCCRNDGDPNDPIYLPRARPFYLYRYNGTCQEVVGLKTTPEYVIFDTDNSNMDAYENDFHPDGSINNVRIELCYYSEL